MKINKMKKTILLLFITAGLSMASAQKYNFLGNHLILNMEAYFSPAWLNPNSVSSNWNISESAQRYLGLNYFLSPSVELIAWEKGTVGVGYNYYNSPFKGTDTRLLSPDDWGYYDFYDPNYFTSLDGNLTAHGFSVFYKQYIGKRFAPLGHYFKFVFDGFFYHYKMDTVGINPEIFITTTEPLGEIIENKGSLFGVKVEYGYDFIVLNRLKLNLAASLGTTFGGYKVPFAKIKNKSSFYDYTGPDDATFDNYARNRILGAYWFGVKLGIGFIPF